MLLQKEMKVHVVKDLSRDRYADLVGTCPKTLTQTRLCSGERAMVSGPYQRLGTAYITVGLQQICTGTRSNKDQAPYGVLCIGIHR